MASEISQSRPVTDLLERVQRRRVMGIFDITLFTVSAMLVVETLTASAAIGAIGAKTIAWWILAVVLFLVDPDLPRPFRIPGGDRFVTAIAALTSVIIAAGIVLFLWP